MFNDHLQAAISGQFAGLNSISTLPGQRISGVENDA